MSSTPTPSSPADIAIVGLGCLFPKASHVGAYWANIKHGIDAIIDTPETHWRPEDYYDADPKRPDFTYGKRGGFLEPIDFNPLAYGMPPNALEATDTAQLLGMVAAERALQDAGYGAEMDFDRDRVSVVLGVTGALELVIPLGARLGHPKWRQAMSDAGLDAESIDDVLGRMAEQYVPWQEASFPGLLGNVVAGRITKHLNLGGTNCVVDAACASSLSAVHLAMLELQAGKSDVVLSGGVDTFNDIFMFMCFSKTPALSPTGNAKPFDASGDGTILGEGLGMVVLKRLADAERDNDRVYAVIKGIGASSDGKGDAIYAPSAPGQVKALKRAYEQAHFDPRTIELIEAHGTGTAKGDAVEISALSNVYGDSETGPWCAIGSVKSQIGHTKAAAGSAALIKATLALYHKILPPTIKVENPLAPLRESKTPFYVNTTRRPWLPREEHPRRAALSALGFGGSNFHCVLEEHGAAKSAPDWDGDIELLAFSGADAAELNRALDAFPAAEKWAKVQVAAAKLRDAFDGQTPCRLVLVVQQHDSDVTTLVAQAKSTLASKGTESAWSLPAGVFYSTGTAPGKLAFLFPGQGTQYVGMMRDLACQFPAFLDVLARANSVYGGDTARLTDHIYPPHAFTPVGAAEQQKKLTATAVAPSAIGAVSAGALRVLEGFGLRADAVAGHSYGEIVGLHAAGLVSEADFHALSKLRGTLMGAGEGDKGAMMAVRAPEARVTEILNEAGLDVIIANKNAPEQMVLAGGTDAIARANEVFTERGIQAKILPVAAAFHSEYVSHVQGPFLEALAGMEINGGETPLYSNTTAGIYPAEVDAIRTLVAEQLARPVSFVEQIQRMHADGTTTFLEIGPGARMSGLVDAILADLPHQTIAIDSSSGKRDGIVDLARTLAELAALGHAVDLAPWNAGCQIDPAALQPAAKLTVPIGGANYVTSRPKKPKTAPRPVAASQAPQPGTAMSNPSNISPEPAHPAPQPSTAPANVQPMEQHLIALQKMQQQTAELHRQFLEGQQAAMETFRALMQQPTTGTMAPAPRVQPQSAAPAPPVPQAVPPVPAPTEQAAPVTAPAAAPPPPAADTHTIEVALLNTIAEKTGYPAEMLELTMSLDADLGIDSIKRVEILSSLKDALPDAPEFGPDQLGQFQTLGDIVVFIAANAGGPVEAIALALSAQPEADTGAIEAALLSTIAEKTGYPAEMLELGMSLDADLGIDSIKRVEILSALKEQLPDAPEFGPDQLGQFQTLGDIVGFIAAHATGDPVGERVPTSTDPAPSAGTAAIEKALLDTIAEKTGYPADMLELNMSLDADLGIDSIKRVEILSALRDAMPEIPEFGPDQLGQFQTLADIVAYLAGASTPAPETPSIAAPSAPVPETTPAGDPLSIGAVVAVPFELGTSLAKLPTGGTIVLVTADGNLDAPLAEALQARGFEIVSHAWTEDPGTALPEALAGLVIVAPTSEVASSYLPTVFTWMQRAGKRLNRAGAGLIASVTQLDGTFGLNEIQGDPESGALAGLIKTAAHEWEELTCRAVDVARDRVAVPRVADALLHAGPIEIGVQRDGYVTLQINTEAPGESGAAPISQGDVIVVSGGARGVTADVALAMAAAWKPTLVLLGRSGAPTPEEPWLQALPTEQEVQETVLQRAGGAVRPRELREAVAAILRNRAALHNIEAMEAAGASVEYFATDIRDRDAVVELLDEVRNEYGPIRGIVHGAGVLADRLIEGKTPEQFDGVYGTKVEGLQALLAASGSDELRFITLFSSSTGRFGRKGQVDYAAANEALNKIAQHEAQQRPNCRVLSVNWGPWAGGMVNDDLAKLFRAEGVGLIGLEDGARFLVNELSQPGDRPVEMVVMGGDIPRFNAGRDAGAPVLSIDLSVEAFPFLRSHVLNNKAVLPVAMISEWFAHTALHAHPGLRFHGFDELRVFKGVTLDATEHQSVQLFTGTVTPGPEGYSIPVELRSNPTGAKEILHAAAGVRLVDVLPEGEARIRPREMEKKAYNNGGLYDGGHLFHGPAFQGLNAVDGAADDLIAALVGKAPSPKEWIVAPLRNTWLADPLILDSSFQMMILWTFRQYGVGSLPSFLARYRQYATRFPNEGARIVVQVTEHNKRKAVADIEFVDPKSGALIARIDGYECTLGSFLNKAFQNNTLQAPEMSKK